MAENSKTVPKQLTPFVKNDPRINRKGRPKNSDDLKALGLSLLHEPARDKDGNPVVIDGHVATNLEMVLRRMMQDKRQSADLLDRVYGKVPQAVHHEGEGGGPIRTVTEVIIGGFASPGQQATGAVLDEQSA